MCVCVRVCVCVSIISYTHTHTHTHTNTPYMSHVCHVFCSPPPPSHICLKSLRCPRPYGMSHLCPVYVPYMSVACGSSLIPHMSHLTPLRCPRPYGRARAWVCARGHKERTCALRTQMCVVHKGQLNLRVNPKLNRPQDWVFCQRGTCQVCRGAPLI